MKVTKSGGMVMATSLRRIFQRLAVVAAILLIASTCAAQAKPADQPPEDPFSQELKKYPGLLDAASRLIEKLRGNVTYPPARSESRLLPLLPEATMFYMASSNYGDALHQVVTTFRRELEENAELRDWWQHGAPATAGPKVVDALEKVYQLSQYLGEELVVSGTMEGKDFRMLLVAEVRKPGLKPFLQQMVNEFTGKSKPSIRILDPQELAAQEEKKPGEELVVLVRPDFVAAALDVATLRSFGAKLDRSSREFASEEFGQRIVQAYQGGATIVGAVDVRRILSLLPASTDQNLKTFQRSGFADMKYMVWQHMMVAGKEVSQSELSFTGPRHGAAAWLAKPAPMGSLDFVSPRAILAGSVLLISPAQIFDDVRELASAGNPNAFAGLAQSEQALKLSLREDLLQPLGGEVTFEVDRITSPVPVMRAILRVNDEAHLQQTLNTLLTASPFPVAQFDEGGITYRTIQIPSEKTSYDIAYAIADGYLIIASSKETAMEAVRLHRSGESLGKSSSFLAASPPGHPAGASAMLYQDPVAMTALKLGKLAPELGQHLPQSGGTVQPTVFCAYGEETAIRGASTNALMDTGVVLVAAAIAIPNLLRSRMAANEAAAVGTIRTANTAEVTYMTIYPQRGYAPDLATLGPDPRGGELSSAEHANLIDASLGNPSCTAGAWCEKSGFNFMLTATCKLHVCKEYVVAGFPVAVGQTGQRSFCSTSDGVIRFKEGGGLTAPFNASDCKKWPPLQ